MPELPEVESVRLSLVPRLVGRVVVSATLHRRDVLIAPGDPAGGFARQRAPRARSARGAAAFTPEDLLRGAAVAGTRRRGKQLAIVGDNDRVLVVQLGMTGHFEFAADPRGTRLTHTHAEWRLDDGSLLVFRDARRFGSLRIFRSSGDLEEHWRSLGPDALTIKAAQLAVALVNSRRPVKAALLDQSLIAGVGNIYADEALFRAGIHPAADASKLTRAQTDRLTQAIRAVLRSAVRAGGSTLRDYADSNGRPGSYKAAHCVYGRGGLPCTVCGRTLVSASLAQRTTVWCPACQPRAAKTAGLSRRGRG